MTLAALFLVALCGSASEQTCATLTIEIESIEHSYFLHEKPGWLSASAYSEMGRGHRNELDLAVLLQVRLSSGPVDHLSLAIAEINVRKGEELVQTVRQRIATYEAIEEYTIPILVNGPLCDDIILRARVLDCEGELQDEVTEELHFSCGE